MENNKPLSLDEKYSFSCHERWIKNRNNIRASDDPDEEKPEEWFNNQCGQCRFYVLLNGVGAFGDWGICSNQRSDFDGRVMFEHDGCDEYSGADDWISEYFEKPVIKDEGN